MVEVLSGPERRLRRTPQEKIAIIQQTMEPGMTVSHVARLHGINATLFIAQLYGIHLGLQELILLVLTMVVTSKGAAGVPGFMFVIMLATLSSAGLPLEGLALIAGVDRIMDMGRTALNVVGNALAPLIIAKWEGLYDEEKGRHYLQSLTCR
ncbi:cation:dicarboxylase symporter family transporter [Brenneria populi]|uniref:Cation:dicarboxylase symporter family transporter n=1 Tax=Brenneria populi TaxID=1505588 RepID=A0ABU6JPU1_9GAMM|nr:cation:dicarboxylase symporter family transporter [Brenneria populi Li et al. 2015]